MAQKSIKGDRILGESIRKRRNELNLTIEDAAKRAGVGTKTWCRYEAGESIRQDKYKGVCKALSWRKFPGRENQDEMLSRGSYRQEKAWSTYLEENFGETAALSFTIGCELLLHHIDEDLLEISTHPKGTHIGQLETSFMSDLLPKQFLMQYDYEFLYITRCKLLQLIDVAHSGEVIVAYSVIEEILLYMIANESDFFVHEVYNSKKDEDWKNWIYDILKDDDVDICLYSDMYVDKNNIYHFSYWMEKQFYC